MHTVLTAATNSEDPGIALLVPPANEILGAAIVLLIIFLIVGKYALPKIYRLIDERRDAIEDGLAAADRAHENESLAEREREEILRRAHAEAREIRERSNDDARRIIATARDEALNEAARVTEDAARRVEVERQAAEISLHTEVGLLATELAEQIVGEHLRDTELTARVVDRFLDQLEKEESTASSGVDSL